MSKRGKFLHLADMQPTMTHFSTVALIVSKSSPNFFYDKMSGTERGVLTLTIRDSPLHLTNCKCWGQRACVEEYSAMLQIGLVVDIVGAKVMSHAKVSLADQQQRYQPQGTISCVLVVNEGSGYLVRHDNDDSAPVLALQQLLHLPLKPLGSALKLADVRSGLIGGGGASAFVDLLVVVAAVRPVREIKRKHQVASGKTQDPLHCLETVVIDASYPEGMLFSIWQADWIRRAQRWQPRHTVLHLVDVRVSHSDYHRCPVLSHSNGTLVCEDPQAAGLDCSRLLAFAATQPVKSFDGYAHTELDNLPTAASIRSQMTVRQIYSRAEGELQDASQDQFTAVLYGMVTKLDLDGFVPNISRKCTVCQRPIPRGLEDCATEACHIEFLLGNDGPRTNRYFNINIHFSDQTGSLLEAHLAGNPAERILGLEADNFDQLTEREKSNLKWRFLLKYFEARLLVKKPAGMRRNLVVVVVDMQAIPLAKLVENMTVF
ncbi:protein hold'em [Drosophila kikkawai]|uniref:Protein hold'em n=1 Tax=Drosophila kikkawai TaxID=30033 RepID=A0A6P4J1H8_DROKI|nr:protein hold'em [Drosophila kikkawai]